MKIFYFRFFTLFAFAHLFVSAQSQQKLVVIGSSTSYGSGTTAHDSTYVARLQKHYNNSGISVTIKNLAAPGTDCYSAMPSNYIPPPGRSLPDHSRNITAALAENPDAVLVNYPSNGYVSFTISEIMLCFRTIKRTANNAGKRCYITTTQPRTEYNAAARVKLRVIKDSILQEFGEFAVNFYDGLAEPVSDTIAGAYRAGDGIHLNNAGHAVLAQRVADKNIFNSVIPPLPPTGPLKFRYYTFTGTWYNLPNLHALTPVSTGSMPNVSLAYRSQNDNFAYLWEGYIEVPVTGTYTFRTTSDDGSQFWIGSLPAPLIDNDGLHGPQDKDGTITLNAGVYPIAFLYYDQIYGEVMNVSWKTPQTGANFVQIPNSAFVDAPVTQPVAGLKYRYFTFSGTWYHMPNLHALTPVAIGTVPNVTLDNRTQNDQFAYIWDGYINIPVTGDYTFRTTSDDGSQFWIGSLPGPLINNDGLHGPQDMDGTITLTAGVYPIAFLYYDQIYGEVMNVSWKTPQTGGNFVAIPNSAFTISAASGSFAIDENIQNYNKSKSPQFATDLSISGSIGILEPGAIKRQGLAIFPNPAVEHVNLTLTNEENGSIQVKLFNANGIVLSTKTYQKVNVYWQQQIHLTRLNPGFYLIQVTGKNFNYRLPFIKK